VWPIGKPSPEEQGRHFLWRFWQRLPPPGTIAIFDRTWYGRILVERVEALARPNEWQRAYDEINAFEKMLVADGIRLVKLFLHISDQERLRRRVVTPTKQWKMTVEDIRNRARRRDHVAALDGMFALTSTAVAPWYVEPAEYKWFARIAVAKTAVKILAKGITAAGARSRGHQSGNAAPRSGRNSGARSAVPGAPEQMTRRPTCPAEGTEG
jgi:AMP-polyphosphate phosphotransferase